MTPADIEALSDVLGVSAWNINNELGAHWWPNRGLEPMPPTDPVVYRLYEVYCTCYWSCDMPVTFSRPFWFMGAQSR